MRLRAPDPDRSATHHRPARNHHSRARSHHRGAHHDRGTADHDRPAHHDRGAHHDDRRSDHDHHRLRTLMTHELLLDIQRFDVEADQLRHRRATLEQRSALDVARADQARQQVEIDELGVLRVEAATRQKRHEDEAQIVSERADKDDARLYGGEVQGMKDLQAMQHEVAGLRDRQRDLEDLALEAMEEVETLAGRVTTLEEARRDVDDRIAVLEAEIAAAEVEIDGQLDDLARQREEAVAQVDPSLVADYERLRSGFGVATVVRFDGNGCVGCPSAMPAMEVDRFKREEPGAVLHCDECGRIVLR